MSLWQKAYETYENHKLLVGQEKEGDKQPLCAVGHIIQKIQIEVTIKADGTFVSANEIPEADARTIIPATEKSASRTSGACAHPLSDSLQYITTIDEKRFNMYLEQLREWEQSEYSHPKLTAILRYVEGGTLLNDLQTNGLLTLQDNGLPEKKIKIAKTDVEKAMVRWRVLETGEEPACWRDQTLFTSFQNYQKKLNFEEPNTLCMISGEQDMYVKNHPKGIVSSSYGAKLISANDKSGFTYRGRFVDEVQTATIGYQASQKAHFALQWLTANQGVIYGGRTFVCWNPKGKELPNSIGYSSIMSGLAKPPITPSDYQRQLALTIGGYRNDLPDNEDIVIAAFDAATTGRLSVTYYSEQRAGDFLNRIEHWYNTCCMPNGKYGFQSPTIYDIAKFAFGVERSGKVELDDKVLREQIQRLLLCMTEQAVIPADIVRALRVRASRPQQYSKNNVYRIQYIACAIIRKYLNDRAKKEEWTMVLDTEKTDRSYLFGRLLAVLEYAERSTYKKDEGREPNAVKMQSVFCERPMYAAKILDEKLVPYYKQMPVKRRIFCKNIIGEIFALLPQEDEPILNRPLEDSYLLGYYLQRNALYTKKTDTNSEENDTEE